MGEPLKRKVGCLRDMRNVVRGTHGSYFWLQSPVNPRNVSQPISMLLRECPNAVRDQYVVVTSLDSGPLLLTEQQIKVGWRRHERLALSPKMHLLEQLPFEWFDEWLIFERPSAPSEVEVFVNYGTFSLADPNPTISTMYMGSDGSVREQMIAAVEPVRERFWTQIEELKPVSYVANGNCFLFVTSKLDILECVASALKSK